MKASKFSDSQIAFVLRQGDEGTPVEEICRKTGISQATYYNWRKKYGGLMPSEMKRLKQLEEENGRLKRIVADLSLDKEMLQDVGYRRQSGSTRAASSYPEISICGRMRVASRSTSRGRGNRPIMRSSSRSTASSARSA